jgi:Copper type II ascorbate-dependent monooxygenase, C-terminal domain
MIRRAVLGLVVALALTGCVHEGQDRRTGSPTELLQTKPPEVEASQLAAIPPGKLLPLRAGEKRMTLTMPEEYTPSAPTGVGTDDYRCFLLDPHLKKDVWLTGSNVLPGNPAVVHHVILFRVPPDKVAEAEAKDAETPDDQGWTCFGGTGLAGDFQNIDDASWLAAWAPGGDETKVRDGYGVRLDAGSRIVMQVHYNLLEGSSPDVSSTQLRWMKGSRDLTPLHTFLLPAPVELPCRPGHDDGPLCDREAAVADVLSRFGSAGNTNSLLHLLCGTDVEPSNTTSCTRNVLRGMTVIGVAGHMHLLGRKISIEANPGTDRARTLLDIPVWDFDNQGIKPIEPLHLDPFDTVKVTCIHQQWLRDRLPAFQGQEERYVVWGEGSTDEMCLGMLQVAFDDGT